MIVAFYSPNAGMGKTTAAEAVRSYLFGQVPCEYAFRTSFANPIKRALSSIFDDCRFAREGFVTDAGALDKDAPYIAECEYPSPRSMMIAIGQAMKELDADFWVKLEAETMDGVLKQGMHVIIDDLRFPREYEMLREHGAKIIRICNPDVTAAPSETEGLLEGYEFDAEIINDGSLEEFKERVVETVKGVIK